MNIALQYLLVSVALGWSVAYIAQRQFPSALRASRVRLALRFLSASRPAWQRRVGRMLAPPPSMAATCAVGASCGGCDKARNG